MVVNAQDVSDYLDQSKVGVIATMRRDGSPHAVPVWYQYDGESILVWTEKNRAWVKNVQRDGRVAFSVQDDSPPFAALVLRGTVTVADRLDDSGLKAAKDICRRYLNDDEVDGYVDPYWPRLHTFVRIVPEKITLWRRGY
ncbi:MAG: TIGR03618 family F420-dependent PPOX class oxidoreductase [SAR202 cluster bacterium]|jgi:PPOX class probable F420-dependent enzyme|nr:PPOX class F420-dependent enzyme [Chloroflexota bacterium]MDP6421048.1 TIGR03618 family F420-dependent PPOX class oxidoreductase [SAR202 cluster bacterium]HAL47332.1 PPOX class F420-dependent enzyme [Dehalococcoidia bacterium]MDP6799099.1 TIGR03618 family F420-dependent PPOX class oxidoreductase [SAR202 cluster bacterium]MQG58179.1 TIGR03618 family F420-dependent PPOX class oxidoreductase [SAR202 cluster bacterium]|tara:strand:- start:2183 stop:2602 length:420 start_codon:yes stop_codon:yes gene_type:complete